MDSSWLEWIVPIAILVAIGFAWWLIRFVLRQDTGTPEMLHVHEVIYEGALAFLRRQYRTIAILAILTGLLIGALIGFFDKYIEVPGITSWQFGIMTGVSFLIGALLSSISGIIAMWTAVKTNVRTASAARTGVGHALTMALRGGAVSGFLVVALSLLGVWGLYRIFGFWVGSLEAAPYVIVGLGFGASFVALFAQLGGGIYTKAADVGADLVGKVEQNIPEDDPRNPAVVADLVGDNVGDCAGRGADLFESTVAESIGAMILGVIVAKITGNPAWILFPLVLRAFGIFASIVGVFVAKMRGDQEDPMRALNRGFYASSVLALAFLALVTYLMLGDVWYWFFGAGIVGLLTALAFLFITQYYTERGYGPVKSIVEASRTGPATNIIAGIAVGMETTALPVLAISVALMAAYWLGGQAAPSLGVDIHRAGMVGTATATMGMLMTAAYILAMDTFGPIADNAGGIVEMSNAPEEVRRGTDALDATGNTTKALTKGYAIGSAALAAFLLFSAYLDKAELVTRVQAIQEVAVAQSIPVEELTAAVEHFATMVTLPAEPPADPVQIAALEIERQANSRQIVDLGKVPVFVGALAGAMLIFLFSSFAIRAVGRAAEKMIAEVRRQFKQNPGIMKGTSKPDYAKAVDISTQAALREMVVPGILAVGLPVFVGITLKAEAAASFLMVGTMAGILMALFLNNGGGAWDNAKKSIEAGELKDPSGKVLKKGSEAHAASVVGDTVGDPFKDTAGPSLHVLIKLLSTITLVLAPLFL